MVGGSGRIMRVEDVAHLGRAALLHLGLGGLALEGPGVSPVGTDVLVIVPVLIVDLHHTHLVP